MLELRQNQMHLLSDINRLLLRCQLQELIIPQKIW